MTIQLDAETEQLLVDRMRESGFADPNDLIFALLSAQGVPEADEALLDALEEAEEDVRAGRVHNWADVRQEIHDAFGKR